jgi:DNA-binding transcriptional ArsR family regulator
VAPKVAGISWRCEPPEILGKPMLTYHELNLIFRALADPNRRYLFERLCDQDEESVSALTEPLPISRQAVLQHLAVLENNGLIRTEKRDRVRWCRIEPRALALLDQWLREYRGHFERRQAPRR